MKAVPTFTSPPATSAQERAQIATRATEEDRTVTASLDSLRLTRDYIRATLLEAEDGVEKGNVLLKRRLGEIQNLAHDIEDILDLYRYEQLRAESEPPQGETEIPRAERGLARIPDSVLGEIACRASGIQERVDEIWDHENYLPVGGADDDDDGKIGFGCLQKGGSNSPREGVFCGREDDIEKVVRLLLTVPDEEAGAVDGCDQPLVIAVVGMGGVGKTALLQKVHHDSRVREHFGSSIGWVSVSEEDFDVVSLTRETLRSLIGISSGFENFHPLQQQLNEKVRGDKFLLVLDDVCNRDREFWDCFKSSFGSCAKGSRILVSTRDQEVASAMQTTTSHQLECLSHEISLQLFRQYAFDHGKPVENRSFKEESGKQIIRKCEGLPLAIKVVGGLLRNDDGVHRWEDVLRSDLWHHGILASLQLSYNYLPVHLKRCFAYCAVFPRGYRISKKELIHLWMAQDLIQDRQGKSAWEIGMYCIDNLLSRSFFQPSPIEKQEAIIIHSLMHDFAGHVSGRECHRIEGTDWSLCPKFRSASLWSATKDEIQFPSFEQIQGLRTLVVFRRRPLRGSLCLELQPYERFSFLRVLDLNGSGITELPDFMGNLKLLRLLRVGRNTPINVIPESFYRLYNLRLLDFSYTGVQMLSDLLCNLKLLRSLDLQGSKISSLPESICMICDLQTINLTECRKLEELPRNIGNLTNLRSLFVDALNRISYFPVGVGRLVDLQSLEWFPVGTSAEHAGMKELQHLVRLRGRLYITGLCNVKGAEDAKAANMKDKEYLQVLVLDWNANSKEDYMIEEKHEDQISKQNAEVLGSLRPHVNLEELEISCYRGLQFPQWLTDPKLNCLVRLKFYQCQNCSSLSDLGQLPFLMLLEIEWMPSLENVNHCTGVTPALRYFTQEFYRSRGLPRRRKLVIHDCVNLKSLQVSVLKLEIKSCENLDSIDFQGNSLIHLKISDCPRLWFTSDTRLPSRIQILEIDSCPFLTEWCHQQNNFEQINTIILDGCELRRRSS